MKLSSPPTVSTIVDWQQISGVETTTQYDEVLVSDKGWQESFTLTCSASFFLSFRQWPNKQAYVPQSEGQTWKLQ